MDKLIGMRVFVQVVETDSFVGAAERLALSPALVTQHIRNLERDLGVHLLSRTTRKYTLTEAGSTYYRRCRQILAGLGELAPAANEGSQGGNVEKVAIFVDVQNIYYTTRQCYRRHFDYNAFWAAATADRKVIKALAYAIERADEKQKQFQNILRGIGFELKLKPYIQRSDGSAKGDWDVGITLDMIEYGGQADVIVLASGDGDFDLLVQKVIRDFAVAVEVYGVPQLTAASLVQAASKFLPIGDNLLLKSKK